MLRDDLGLVPGNRVLLRGPNNPMMAASCFAVIKAGGVAVATMPLLRAQGTADIVAKAKIALALCDARSPTSWRRPRRSRAELQRVVSLGQRRAGWRSRR